MPKLFSNDVPHGQHVQITLDILPADTLDQEEVRMLLDVIRRGFINIHKQMGIGILVTAHHIHQCTTVKCAGIRAVIEEADKQYHKQEGTEHSEDSPN